MMIFKQIIGLVVGILNAFLMVKGMLGFIFFFSSQYILGLLYSKNYLEIDEDEIENS